MKKRQKITTICIASGFKILMGIYLWFNFFDVFPGSFKNLTIIFFSIEFIEHVLLNMHKEKNKNNFWEADIDYNRLFYSAFLDLVVFWATFILIIYANFLFRYNWLTGVIAAICGIIAVIIIFYWLSKRVAQVIFCVIEEIKITKTFNDYLNF